MFSAGLGGRHRDQGTVVSYFDVRPTVRGVSPTIVEKR
jgi:hypothetical protein